MGCSSSKFDHLSDSVHLMIKKDSRTKMGTGTYKKPLRRDSTGTQFDSLAEIPVDESRHLGRPLIVSKLPAHAQ